MVLSKIHNSFRGQLQDGQDKVRLLYKYKTFNKDHLEAMIRAKQIFFSTHAQLNDPMDLVLRYPEEIRKDEFRFLEEVLAPYDGQSIFRSMGPKEILAQAEVATHTPPIDNIRMMFGQMLNEDGLSSLNPVRTQQDYLLDIFGYMRALLTNLTEQTGIFCVVTDPFSKLMWAHYGDSYRGLCIGYICESGKYNPQRFRDVVYSNKLPRISSREIVSSFDNAYTGLLRTKHADWSYEREVRLLSTGYSGLQEEMYPIKEVIFGSRMPEEQQQVVIAMDDAKEIDFYRARLVNDGGNIEMRREPLLIR